jgi:hypothetical protein
MDEPVKENPKTPKRSRRKPAMEPLGWDEIVSQPGMGGYLSFLNGPVPLPHLQGSATAPTPGPGVVLHPGPITAPELVSSTDPTLNPEAISDTDPGTVSPSGIDSVSAQVDTDPAVDLDPRIDIAPEVISSPDTVTTPQPYAVIIGRGGSIATPEVVSIPAVHSGPRLRIRRCSATHDGHSLGEEVLYQALWKAAHPESADARTIVIGWRGMSQLCRMTPKNCKINTQRLIRKLALEVLSPYNTPESIGTTYRVHSDQAILQRRRAAGFEWVVRSRGVEFVDPATGLGIMPICAHT